MSEEISITDFNADKARQYVNEWEKDQINRVLEDIIERSINGRYLLIFNGELTNDTINKLKEKGFTVNTHDFGHYKIEWK